MMVMLHDHIQQVKPGRTPGEVAPGLVRLYGAPVTIVGVLPKTFRLLHARTDTWVTGSNVDVFAAFPETAFTQGDRARAARSIFALARLRPGVSYAQAQAVLDRLATRLRSELPLNDLQELQLKLLPLHEDLASGLRPVLAVLAAAVVFLLLLVFFNVISLMLVRSEVQARDDAVRAAIGCGKLRLFRQRIAESLFLALAGGAVGIGLAWAAIRALENLAPRSVPLLDRIEMDGSAVLCGLAVALAAA
jgi:putative ABC transport system permease protein